MKSIQNKCTDQFISSHSIFYSTWQTYIDWKTMLGEMDGYDSRNIPFDVRNGTNKFHVFATPLSRLCVTCICLGCHRSCRIRCSILLWVFFPLPPNPHFLCCAFSVWFAYRIQIQLEKFFLESGLHSLHRHFLSVYPFDGQCCSVRHTSLALFFGSVFAFLFFCWVSFIFLFCCYKYFQCLRHEHNERELLDKNPSLNSKRTKIE